MGLGEVAIATLPSVIFPKLMFSDGLGGKVKREQGWSSATHFAEDRPCSWL